MREYTVITVDQDLLPQVVGELLQFANDPNLVDVVLEASGRVIHAHPEVAEAWWQARQKLEEEKTKPAPAPEPLAKEKVPSPAPSAAPAPPKKKTTSA